MLILPTIYSSKFLKIYNRELPVINKNIRTYSKNHKPWVTAGILKSIHHKHNLYKRFVQNKDSKSESKYKTYKNKLTRIIRIAEKMYYVYKFNLALGNIKNTWDIIKNITLGCDHPNSQSLTEIKVDNNLITDSNIMANKFNSFFSKVGPVLANKIPKTHGDISDYMSSNFSKSMGIIDTNADEIIMTVNLLKFSFSKGVDDISSVVTKKVINEISLPFSIIFNKSFQLGQFRDKLKIAKIIPIFKSEDKLLINNYRSFF